MKKPLILKIGLVILSLLILSDLLFLNWRVLKTKEVPKNDPEGFKLEPISTPLGSIPDLTTCPIACLDKLYEATATIKLPTLERQNQTSDATTKELFIPLGSGSTKETTWVDLGGIETYIDTAKYSKIKEANFEATLRIPTANGRAYARLYNINEKHPVWGSEVWEEGQTGKMIKSSNLSLDQGNKLYRVQMYSTLGYEAFLDNARIRIVYE